MPTEDSNEIAIVFAESTLISNYITIAPLALIIYDSVLTFDKEIQVFWSRKLPRAAYLLFALMRLTLIGLVVSSFPLIVGCHVPYDAVQRCAILYAISNYAILGMSMLLTAIISAMRVYAVTSRNWVLTSLTLSFALVPVVCLPFLIQDLPNVDSVSRICAIASDVVVIGTTWRNTFYVVKFRLRDHWPPQPTLSWYLLRDGTAYFVVMLILNIVDLFLFIFTGDDTVTFLLIYPLSAFFLWRLLFNLREAAYTSGGLDGTSGFLDVPSRAKSSTVVFADAPVEDDDPHLPTTSSGNISDD
ncbi:uncharacterized protein B0H18DRAFT_1019322 [Fomitopsis serialis]|uniref:uncharacterized protein n=1 Tax=Fomitopsis serialis TaxID=139415 RepID=UPI0020087AB2|nr:uncharacterized protein B0H18DRAFT_1019322 [Neoantrodia serialis]KAH9921841.1 hypothetical protein B0H18DRAFT_1019322 [Neoantrodia serialis]